MCACGCLVVLGLGAAIAYCVLHQLWLPAAGIVILGAVLGWLGFQAMRKS